jgi:hypothetical protein
MPQQKRIRAMHCYAPDDFRDRHGTKFGVEQLYIVAVIDQRTANAEESQGRQVIIRNPAAYRGVRRIDDENTHAIPLA